MAPFRMSQMLTSTQTSQGSFPRTPTRLVRWIAGLLILVLLALHLTVLVRMREHSIIDSERDLSTLALALADQADRAVLGADLVLDSIARFGATQGVVDASSFNRIMAGRTSHDMLRERMIGLPQINALMVFGIDGYLKNNTLAWPIPAMDVRDRDFINAMLTDPAAIMMISPPFQRHGEG